MKIDFGYVTSPTKNPKPSEAKEGDFYENPQHGEGVMRKYILEIRGDRALILEVRNSPLYEGGYRTYIDFYSGKYSTPKLCDLRRWGMHGNR